MKTPFQTVLSGVSQPWGVSLPSHAVVGCAQEQLCRSRRARPRSGAGSSVPRVSGSRWCLWSGTDGDSSERSGSGRNDQFPSKPPYSTLQAGCSGGRLPAAASWAAGLHAGSGAGSLLTGGTAPVRSVPQNSQDRHLEQPCPGCTGSCPAPTERGCPSFQPGTAGGKPRVRHRPQHGGGRVSPCLPPHPPHPVPHCRWMQLGIHIPDWLLINAAPLIALTQLCSVSLPQSHRPGLGLGMMETGGALGVLLRRD